MLRTLASGFDKIVMKQYFMVLKVNFLDAAWSLKESINLNAVIKRDKRLKNRCAVAQVKANLPFRIGTLVPVALSAPVHVYDPRT